MGKELTLGNSIQPLSILILVVVVAFYVQFQARNLLSGPTILLQNESGVTEEEVVIISGNAQNIVELHLNGKTIHTNEQGDFRELILLPQGYNIVTVSAEDRFGRTTSLTREYVYKPALGEV